MNNLFDSKNNFKNPNPRWIEEIHSLDKKSALVNSGELTAYLAKAEKIPTLLKEIGRLREITFQLVGEGTGKETDLDNYDKYYEHLFIWNHELNEPIGAYRIGRTDKIVQEHGINGLYTRSIFTYENTLLKQLSPSIELGRSFVRPEFQKQHRPLMMLWKGIAQIFIKEPKYKYSFGPVSISPNFATISQRFMISFLEEGPLRSPYADMVAPTTPHELPPLDKEEKSKLSRVIDGLEEIDELVKALENSEFGMPVLLRQYLKLNAKILAFNVDPNFSGTLDALMTVKFTDISPRILKFFFGEDGAAKYLNHHGINVITKKE